MGISNPESQLQGQTLQHATSIPPRCYSLKSQIHESLGDVLIQTTIECVRISFLWRLNNILFFKTTFYIHNFHVLADVYNATVQNRVPFLILSFMWLYLILLISLGFFEKWSDCCDNSCIFSSTLIYANSHHSFFFYFSIWLDANWLGGFIGLLSLVGILTGGKWYLIESRI